MSEKKMKIGKYDIVGELGKGAMGVVYKGVDPDINRTVAIKTLSRNAMEIDSEEFEARFKIEAQAAGCLNHPNIISIYEFGKDEEHAFIAMEFVDGCSLSELGKCGRLLGIKDIWKIMSEVLKALQFVHDKGIVHRDIKPSNIMYTEKGEVKIADFGIARLESSTRTQTGTVFGTLGYMSPEQIQGHRVDHRSDIFSIGVVLYELLTGERAFHSENITASTYKTVHAVLTPASKVCPTVPGAVDPILEKALAKNPDDRYQSAGEFEQALANMIDAGASPATGATGSATTANEAVIQPINNALPTDMPTRIVTDQSHADSDRTAAGVRSATTSSQPADNFQPETVKHTAVTADNGTAYGYRKVAAIGLGLVSVIAILAFMLKPFVIGNNGDDDIRKQDLSGLEPGEPADKQASKPTQLERAPGTAFSDCDSCPEMMVIPPGSFIQGASAADIEREPNEGAQHNVTLSYPLAVGMNEITRAQFNQFVTATGHTTGACWTYDGEWKLDPENDWRSPGFSQDENHPVTCVSWKDAQAYTRWLAGKTGEKYRLLSESEWEFAARAGTVTARSWGDKLDAACQASNVADTSANEQYPGWEVHNCTDRYIHTAPVGLYKANDFGVYDMLGNVFEWTEDCWNDNYEGSPVDGSAWTGGDCNNRVLRGGSWYSTPRYVRSAFRNRFKEDHRSSSFGFRVARELESS